MKIISVIDRDKKRVFDVECTENKFKCRCKRFERFGVLCRLILWILKDKGYEEIPTEYLLNKWSLQATCRPSFNVENASLLEDCASLDTRKHQISELWSEVFTFVVLVEDNESSADELLSILQEFNKKQCATKNVGKSRNKKREIEILIGSKIPNEATVLPPKQSKNKGSGRRIMSDKEKAVEEHIKPLRKCRACGEMAHHDSRNCPSKD
ncbi:hypothetical protein vseg_013438 [Gypsophila vaccaria]